MFCSGLTSRSYESLKVLCCLACAGEPMRARQIAVAADLPPAQTAKILQAVTRAGFVKSRRGANGGFWLARPAQQIQVAAVISSVDKSSERPGEEHDAVMSVLARAFDRCKRAFGLLTIADLEKAAHKLSTRAAVKKPARLHRKSGMSAPTFRTTAKTR